MFSDPISNIKQLLVPHGATVVDMGAGAGYYTLAVAEVLSGSGTVYAVDIQKDLLELVTKKAQEKHFSNVHVVWGDFEVKNGVKLRDHIADIVILSNVLFQVPDKEATLGEARRLLKAGGKMLLVDWSAPDTGGPRSTEYVPQSTAQSLAEKVGFRLEKTISAGAHHYGMILRI